MKFLYIFYFVIFFTTALGQYDDSINQINEIARRCFYGILSSFIQSNILAAVNKWMKKLSKDEKMSNNDYYKLLNEDSDKLLCVIRPVEKFVQNTQTEKNPKKSNKTYLESQCSGRTFMIRHIRRSKKKFFFFRSKDTDEDTFIIQPIKIPSRNFTSDTPFVQSTRMDYYRRKIRTYFEKAKNFFRTFSRCAKSQDPASSNGRYVDKKEKLFLEQLKDRNYYRRIIDTPDFKNFIVCGEPNSEMNKILWNDKSYDDGPIYVLHPIDRNKIGRSKKRKSKRNIRYYIKSLFKNRNPFRVTVSSEEQNDMKYIYAKSEEINNTRCTKN